MTHNQGTLSRLYLMNLAQLRAFRLLAAKSGIKMEFDQGGIAVTKNGKQIGFALNWESAKELATLAQEGKL